MNISQILQYVYERYLGSEFNLPFVLSGLFFTIVYLFAKHKKSLRESIAIIFNRRVWTSKSTHTDIIISIFYTLFLSVPSAIAFMYAFDQGFAAISMSLPRLDLQAPVLVEAMLATLVVTLAIDFATFVIHYAMHKLPVLWHLHSIHHAATELNIFTTHRQHPLEPLILNLTRGFFAAVGLSLFYMVFPAQTPVIMFMGVSAIFFFYQFTVNLHHLHVPVTFPKWIRYIFVSPHVHHIHHSLATRHFDKNFAVLFSFWDRLAGTYCDEEVGLDELRFGLQEDPYQHSIFRSVFLPVLFIFGYQQSSGRQSWGMLGTRLVQISAIASLALVISGNTLGQARQTAKFSIIDRNCANTYTQAGQIYHRPTPIEDGDKPFVCTRLGETKTFSCYSTRHDYETTFSVTYETQTRLILSGNPPVIAVIDVDKSANSFTVHATFTDETRGVVSEACTGVATTE